MKYKAIVHVWSKIGNCPITNRKGNYCDELARVEILATDHKDARKQGREIAKATKHGHKFYVGIPELPNQNLRSHWETI